MKPARYRDIPAADIPQVELAGGSRVKVIAGAREHQSKTVSDPINGLSTES